MNLSQSFPCPCDPFRRLRPGWSWEVRPRSGRLGPRAAPAIDPLGWGVPGPPPGFARPLSRAVRRSFRRCAEGQRLFRPLPTSFVNNPRPEIVVSAKQLKSYGAMSLSWFRNSCIGKFNRSSSWGTGLPGDDGDRSGGSAFATSMDESDRKEGFSLRRLLPGERCDAYGPDP